MDRHRLGRTIDAQRAADDCRQTGSGPRPTISSAFSREETLLDNRGCGAESDRGTEWPMTRDLIIADTDRKARGTLAEEHIMIVSEGVRRRLAGTRS